MPHQLSDDELKRVPVLPAGTCLRQGATYVNLADEEPYAFTARGYVTVGDGDAFALKDDVPFDIWHRLIGEPQPTPEHR